MNGMRFWLCLAALVVTFALCAETKVTFVADDIVRIVKTPTGGDPVKRVPVVILKPTTVRLVERSADGKRTWKSAALSVTLDEASGCVSFFDAAGNLLLRENADVKFTTVRGSDLRAKQSFALEPDEAVYGLGMLQNGKLSQRRECRWLLPENTQDGIPFIQSVKGWGIYWDELSPVRFADGPDGMSFESDATDGVDYYFMYGRTTDGTVAAMRRLTGDVPMMPLWSYGFWQSRERYTSQEELLKVVRDYRGLGIPLDGIVQDWQYWGGNDRWNAMDFGNPAFPDPKGMVDAVHALHAHMIISVWCSFGTNTPQYAELDKMGAIFRSYRTWHPDSRAYDVWNAQARSVYWKYLSKLGECGVDGWWMDSTEPEPLGFRAADVDKANTEIDVPTAMGPMRRVRSAYPLLAVGNVSSRERKAHPDRRTLILTRCGFAGQQRYTCNVWSGDIASNWLSLGRQVTACLGMSLSGLPHVNCDISGFFPTKELTGELYARWMQFGAFLPLMRSHGTGVKRELNEFCKVGDTNYIALVKAVKLRYRLLPYTYSLSHDVSANRASFLRPLAADFAADKKTWAMGNEFLYGKSFLVAPVLGPGVTEMTPYLPAGADWWDFRSERKYAGGTSPKVPAPLDSSPVFVRAGSVVPYGPDVQYAAEKPWDALEVVVYPGADGSFVLYEDAGDGYGYEKGEFTEIPMRWDDKRGTLTIGKRKGAYPGALKKRSFLVRLAGGSAVRVAYRGERVTVDPSAGYSRRADFREDYRRGALDMCRRMTRRVNRNLPTGELPARPGVKLGPIFSAGGYFPQFFLWDTCFNVMWARHFPEEGFPVESALDNFYKFQEPSGYICREIFKDGTTAWKERHPIGLNPPLLAWAELEAERSGATTAERLRRVFPNLERFHAFYRKTCRRGDGLYFSTIFGCGMDDLPRWPIGMAEDQLSEGGIVLGREDLSEKYAKSFWDDKDAWVYRLRLRQNWNRQAGWIDTSAQMAFDCLNLAAIADILGETEKAKAYRAEHGEIAAAINANCWDETRGFYFDCREKGVIPRYHVGAFWTLIAKVAPPDRAKRMLDVLFDEKVFWCNGGIASLGRNDPDYDPRNTYWKGSVWPPTVYMTILGLKANGFSDEADRVARRWYDACAQLWDAEREIYENIQPDDPWVVREKHMGCDWCGWSALAPLALPIEMGWEDRRS